MREIREAQRLSILNKAITIVAEEPEGDGAPSQYEIRVARPPHHGSDTMTVALAFQRGAVGAEGANVNGISDEALIEVLIHRLKIFQSGKWACETNQTALTHLQHALSALEDRTARRRSAGVEGTTNLMAGEKGHAR